MTTPSDTTLSGSTLPGTTPSGTTPSGTTPAGTPPAGTPPAGTPPAGTTPAGTARPVETYAHGHHASVLRSHGRRTVADSAAYLLPYLQRLLEPTQQHLPPRVLDVLDVGCGPGSITLDLSRLLGDAGRVTGLDFAAPAVDAARSAAKTATDERVRFEVGDVYALDFPDDTFDVVHAHQVLQHLADPVAALVEMRRVCRPGGLVAARDADYAAMTWFPPSVGLTHWLDLYERVARAGGGEPDAGRRLLSWARRAGFADVASSAAAWCYAAEDRRWWGRSWAERVRESAFGSRALDLGLATRDDLEQLAQAWLAWSEDPDGWFTVLHGEVVARA